MHTANIIQRETLRRLVLQNGGGVDAEDVQHFLYGTTSSSVHHHPQQRNLSVISESSKMATQQAFGCLLFFVFVGIVATVTVYTRRRRQREKEAKVAGGSDSGEDGDTGKADEEEEVETVVEGFDLDVDGNSISDGSDEDNATGYYPMEGLSKGEEYVRIIQDDDDEPGHFPMGEEYVSIPRKEEDEEGYV